MSSKFITTIKLMQKEDGKYKPKQFKSAEFLPGTVLEDATSLQIELEAAVKTNDMENIKPVMRKAYDFIGETVFEGQFTGEEYLNGMDAREVMKVTQQILLSVTAGYDSVYAEHKKVTELLYHPNFDKTVQYREAEIKVQLLFDLGWTLNEIENTDLNELMKLVAFRDARDEFAKLKHLDENTLF